MYNFKVTVSVFWVAMLCATAISGYPEDEGNTFLSNTGTCSVKCKYDIPQAIFIVTIMKT